MDTRKLVKLLILLFAVAGLLFVGNSQAEAQKPLPPGKALKMTDHKPMTNAERIAAAQRAAKARHAAGITVRPNTKMIPPKQKGPKASSSDTTTAQVGAIEKFTSFLTTAAVGGFGSFFAAPSAPSAAVAPNAGGGVLGQADYFGVYPNYANSPFPASVSIFGDGSGALATVTVNADGTIGGFTVVNGGSGYTIADVNVIGGGGSGGTGTATIDATTGAITAIAVANAGSGYGTVPGIRKFVDTLPGLTAAGANDLGQYIPVAIPDTTSYPGSDYYEISLVEYTEQMHSDLPPTTLRGYKQTNTTDPTVSKPSYLGPIIVAQRDRPVRIKFTNNLPTGSGGDLFIPVDTTDMGAGMGPKDATGADCDPMVMGANCAMYTQNRATLHLHGGNTPWISDGTPHQWTTPAGENTQYPEGVSVKNVPDMDNGNEPQGTLTFYYTNQQSARLMFYHDHSYGITRLNVYAGEAAGYIVQDSVEKGLIDSGILPSTEIPLVIQDKTFVPSPAQLAAEDPTWDTSRYGGYGNLWFPHIYMPNQNPWDESGANAMGRWDYAEWFWPPYTGLLANGSIPNPLCDQTATPPTCPAGEPPRIPGTPNPSLVPEGFVDTPVVNGTLYPVLKVDPKAYRFRILNAANDRMWNLSLFQAGTEVNGAFQPCSGDLWSGNTLNNNGCSGEVPMVPAVQGGAGTAGYTSPDQLDARAGGVPDSRAHGPAMVQIGTEGGFLPAPVTLPNGPVGYNYNRRDIVVLNVSNKSLFLGPAERADVVVDFSQYAGKTLILYSDAPAPVPAYDTRNDYYTGDPDQTSTGGAPSTLPGYGPNTRTIMQIQVAGSTPAATYDTARLNNAFASTATSTGVFAGSQDPIIVPEAAYNSAYNATYTNSLVRIQDTSLSFTPAGQNAAITESLAPKAIQELFETQYGRMNATLGVEVPFTNGNNQTTVPLGYIDPTTEGITGSDSATQVGTTGDGTQIWKVTHNGVDTHAIHFHLFNVQLINRVGWDGAIRKPNANELGWKETVIMNPLEDAIVALRPIAPTLPWTVPTSTRSLDVTRPANVSFSTLNPLTGNATTASNAPTDFGWEYVWHCHLLGHEENDMMRPIKFTPGQAPYVIGELTDTTAPKVVTFQSLPLPAGGLNVYLAATDNAGGSGVASISYSLNGGSPTPVPGNYATIAIPGSTNTTVTYYATDNAGNSSAPQTLTFTFTVTPTVSASASPTPNAAGWNNADVTVTFNATPVSPATVSSITYSASGAQNVPSTTVNTNPASLVINTEGTTTITYSATDSSGNSSTPQTLTVNLDKTMPALTWSTPSPAPNIAGWNNTPVNVPWTASDATSGVSTPGTSGTLTISTEGASQTGTVTVTDVAGNSQVFTSAAVNIDLTKPVPNASLSASAPANTAGWFNASPVNVNLSATDAGGSGLTDISYTASGATIIGSTSLGTAGGSFQISNEGITTISYTATDGAGNIATGSIDVKIDTVAPTLAWGTPVPAPNIAGWNNTAVNIPWTATDATSGVATPGASGTLTISTEGANQTGTVTVTDVAGNSQTFTSPAVNIDLTAPAVTAALSPTPSAAGWNNTSPVTVNFLATDGLSGVASITYSVNGGSPVTTLGTTASVSISAQGVTTISYYATDNVGNAGKAQTVNVQIDTTAPTASATLSPAPNAAGWNNSNTTVNITGADSGSGVASVTYSATGAQTIASTNVNGSTAAPVISTEGTTTVSFFATDNAGNVGATQTVTVKLDKTAPTLTATANPPSAKAGKGTVSVNITGTASDLLSGLVLTSGTYSISNGAGSGTFTISSTGTYSFKVNLSASKSTTYTITVKVSDQAGNIATATCTFTVK